MTNEILMDSRQRANDLFKTAISRLKEEGVEMIDDYSDDLLRYAQDIADFEIKAALGGENRALNEFILDCSIANLVITRAAIVIRTERTLVKVFDRVLSGLVQIGISAARAYIGNARFELYESINKENTLIA